MATIEVKGHAAVTPGASGSGELWGWIWELRQRFFLAAGVVTASVPAVVTLVKLLLRHHPAAAEGAGSVIEHGGERIADALLDRSTGQVWGLKARF